MSQCKPDPSKFARSRFASRAPSTCRTCMLACDGSEAAVNGGTDGCFKANGLNDSIDGVYEPANGVAGTYIGAPGVATAFDAFAMLYPGALLADQVAAQSIP